jgi:hypothetical protein
LYGSSGGDVLGFFKTTIKQKKIISPPPPPPQLYLSTNK